MDKITLQIDGNQINAQTGKTILDVARENNIHIPTLCYLKNLSPVGACRMCLVEVEGMRKVATACTTPVTQGMIVKTQTPKLQNMRRITLELLFSERNHFCPFCVVSGGDCELQNLGYQHKMDHIRYPYLFPNLPVDSSNPYFLLDHNRCILCSRCIRYCDEIEGVHTLDLSMRGGRAFITVDLHQSFENSTCTSCGGCVQVCPTGAFFDKLGAFRGKSANCKKTNTICQQCSLGCEIDVYSMGNHIVKIDGDVSSEFNEGHLCVKGRYEPLLNHKERIVKPTVSQKSTPVEFSWDKVLGQVANRLKRFKTKSPDAVQAFISPQSTNESVYLFLKLFREIVGTPHAELLNRYEYSSFVKSVYQPESEYFVPDLESDISRLDDSDCVVILGADPGRTHKVLASRIRSRVRKQNVPLITINLRKAVLDDISNIAIRVKHNTDGILLNSLIHAILDDPKRKQNTSIPENMIKDFSEYSPEIAESKTGIAWDKIVQIARLLQRAENPVFVYGRGISNQNNPGLFHTLILLSRLVGRLENGKLPILGLRHGANARGAFEMDKLVPNKKDVLDNAAVNPLENIDPEKTKILYLALGDDEFPWTEAALEKLSKIEFVIVQASYPSEVLKYAHVILPSPVWYEKSGTMNNSQGVKQILEPIFPLGDIQEDWQIFAELINRLTEDDSHTIALPVRDRMKYVQKEIENRLSDYRMHTVPVDLEKLSFKCISYLVEEKQHA